MSYNCLNIVKWTEAQLKYTYDVSLQEATPQELHEALAKRICSMTKLYGRQGE